MPPFKDLTGQTFHRLTVTGTERVFMSGAPRVVWVCRCECGREARFVGSNIRKVKSCGCSKVGKSPPNKTHGRRQTRLYATWAGVVQRCTNPRHISYSNYGGRGITMAPEWRASFEEFAAHLGEPPSPKHSIDRIDTNGNYEPGNVRWATRHEQMNNKRNNHPLTMDGETKTIAQWAEATGITTHAILYRVNVRHWDVRRALTTPLGGARKKLKSQ